MRDGKTCVLFFSRRSRYSRLLLLSIVSVPLRYATSLPNVENVVEYNLYKRFRRSLCTRARVRSLRSIGIGSRGGFSRARLSATYTITLPKLFNCVLCPALAKLRLREIRLVLKCKSLVSRI